MASGRSINVVAPTGGREWDGVLRGVGLDGVQKTPFKSWVLVMHWRTPCPPTLPKVPFCMALSPVRSKSVYKFVYKFLDAGRWPPSATRETNEAPPTISRRPMLHRREDIHKAGKIGPGARSVWSWSRGSGIVGAVCLVVETDAIEISGYVSTGTAIEPVQEVMQSARVPARFANRPCGRGRGATSMFLLCPGCRSRRRKLYIVGRQCRCRDCHRLSFAVEGKGSAGRRLHKAAKVRAKLGAAPGFASPVPPQFVPSVVKRGGRGAGRRKYGHLVQQIVEADRAALSGMMAAADGLASSVDAGPVSRGVQGNRGGETDSAGNAGDVFVQAGGEQRGVQRSFRARWRPVRGD